MKKVIGNLVHLAQATFVPGGSINDNVLLAHEVIHNITHRKTGKKGRMTVKIDMQKAYDRISWNFLRQVLSTYGFPPNWVTLIMNCVSTVSYEVLINGVPKTQFKPKTGLRQGDPLSPYLFVMCINVVTEH